MKWLLYGDLGERHVVDSFSTALREAGHDLARIPSLEPVTGALDAHLRRSDERRRLIDAAGPADVLFVFRVDELLPELIRHAHDAGAVTIGWFCDDPLYYGITYRHVAEAYDITLHTAREDLLAFYEERHGVRGYAFPYWTDDAHYPYVYDPEAADVDVGFVGSFGGARRRRWRYDLLASLPFRVRSYGPLTRGLEDEAAIGAGAVPGEEVPRVLRRFRLGLNVAQSFEEVSKGENVFFDELRRFGEYFFPSRLIAYAAAGVPALTLHHPGSPAPLSSGIGATSRAELIERAREVLADRELLRAASRAAREEFEACLTARSRVRMLERLVTGSRDYDLGTRADMWRSFSDRSAPSPPHGSPSQAPMPEPIEALAAGIPDPRPAGRSLRILLVGWMDAPLRALVRGARLLGHDAGVVDLTETPDLIASGIELARGDGPVELDDERLGRIVAHVRPDVALFADGAAPTERTAEALRSAGTGTAALRLRDPAFLPETVSYLDRFDLVATTSRVAAQTYRAKGFHVAQLSPAGEPPADLMLPGPGIALRSGGTASDVALATRVARAVALVEPGAATIEAFLPDTPGLACEAAAAMGRGAGAIVPEGTHLPDARPDRTVLVYRSPAELVALAAYYARRTVEAEALRRGSFRNMLGHRWSHQLPQLLGRLAPIVRPAGDRPRVVVLGYYGSRNLGDDLILDVIVSRLDARIDVLGYGPYVPADHGLPATSALDHEAAEDLLRDADLLVVGGGGLLHDRELAGGAGLGDVFAEATRAGITGVIARTIALADMHGTPVALLAVGAGPVSTAHGRTLTRFLAERTALVSVRDAASEAILRESGYGGEVLVAADPTLLLDEPDTSAARAWLAERGIHDHLAVSLRRWTDAPTDFSDRVAALLDAVAERTGLRIVFLPLQESEPGRRDRAAAAAVMRRMRRADAAVEVEGYDRSLLRGLLASARAGVAMRLHASILANVAGVPTVGIGYDPKVEAYYDEIGRGRYAVGLGFDPRAATKLVVDLAEGRDRHAPALARALEPTRERARQAFDALDRLLSAPPKRGPRTREDRDRALRRARSELAG